MYQINHLSFQYALSQRPSLNDVSLTIREGSLVLIAGASGSGKTTLLRHLKKELMPKGRKNGDVLYQGKSVESLNAEQSVREVGYLFQNPSHQIVMDTVWHEIAFGLENLGMPYEQMKRTVAEIVNYFDLQSVYHRQTEELSGGQKQMVNLAALTAMHPRVLILDEPTAQLDPTGRKNFLDMVRKLQKEFQMTIILAAHNLEDVMEMADQCVIMEEGRIIADGTTEEVIGQMHRGNHPIKQAFPQIIRLAENLNIKPTFSMGKMKRAVESISYRVKEKKKQGKEMCLRVRHLYASYGEGQILHDLSLELKKQELFVAAGANGSGKSTMLKCIAGQMAYDGKIECKDRIVYLPQDPCVVFFHDQLGADLEDASKGEDKLPGQLVEMCGLESRLDCHPYDLSGGEQQMAALAKVLLAKPQVLLLDEPTKGMDRDHVRKFGTLLKKLQKGGLTILCVSHDLEFAAEFADRMGMMFDGKLEGIDVPEKFLTENYFYTTTTAKITRDAAWPAILPENVRHL